MMAERKNLKAVQRVYLDRDGELVATEDLSKPEAERHVALTRRGQALLAAAGMDGPHRRWYAVSTAHNAEKNVERLLNAAGIEAWLPVKKTVVRIRHRRVRREAPIFRGYLFVRIAPTDDALAGLAAIRGVSAFIGRADRSPAPIADRVMETLQELVRSKFFEERKAGLSKWREGERVSFSVGSLSGFEGVIQGYVGTRAVRVLWSLFGSEQVIEVSLQNLRSSA